MEINKKTLYRIFLCVCGCILLYWLLHETDRVKAFLNVVSGLFSPFVFGGVLAFILNVPMRAIENGILKKIKIVVLRRVLALTLTILALLLVIALVFWLLIPQVVDTVKSLVPSMSSFFTRVEVFVDDFLNKNPELLALIKENTNIEDISLASMAEKIVSLLGNSISAIIGGAVSAIGKIFSGVFNAVIAIVFGAYCLFQKETLARQGRKVLYAFLKEKTADNIVRVLRLTNSSFSNFLSGQCVEVCILGAMFAICMAIFRMPYIPLISVVIAVTAFVPIIGSWIGCAIGAFLILVYDPMLAVWFVVMFVILQQIENNLIYPRVVGTSVGLSGMWVLVAITIGGELMGVVGMFLMIPLASVLYSLSREYTNKKLDATAVDADKLQPQPFEAKTRFKSKREAKQEVKDAPEKSEE